mgnify:CR=1 FL=1
MKVRLGGILTYERERNRMIDAKEAGKILTLHPATIRSRARRIGENVGRGEFPGFYQV